MTVPELSRDIRRIRSEVVWMSWDALIEKREWRGRDNGEQESNVGAGPDLLGKPKVEGTSRGRLKKVEVDERRRSGSDRTRSGLVSRRARLMIAGPCLLAIHGFGGWNDAHLEVAQIALNDSLTS
ncbi:hypothetical protein NL676_014733 [Syzygium grande]|nr:hypothetical protein NL676_014733 [Syzygium grande]